MELRNLPDDLAREIVWRTLPVDAARLATLSKWLKSVADSDVVWEKFVPSDWAEMVSSKSKSTRKKKELFVSLCLNPIFPDDGKLGFFVDKRSGNKCYVVVARVYPYFRMDIRGQINVGILSPNCIYGAYLVYKLRGDLNGLRSLNAVVRVVEHETETEAETRAILVHLVPRSSTRSTTQSVINANFPVTRDDGWLEILLGTFDNHSRYHGRDHLEARLMEIGARAYGEFTIKAIHFRPL